MSNCHINPSLTFGDPFGHGGRAPEIGARFGEAIKEHSGRGRDHGGRSEGGDHCGGEDHHPGGPARYPGEGHGFGGCEGGESHLPPLAGPFLPSGHVPTIGGCEGGDHHLPSAGGPFYSPFGHGPSLGGPGWGGPAQGCGGPEPGCGAPPSSGQLKVDSNANTVSDGQYTYKASTANGGQLQVIDNSTGKVIDTVWGDPHINTANGGTANFQNGPVTFNMPNGTQVTMTPTAQPQGQKDTPQYLSRVSITSPNGSTAEINYSSQPGQSVTTTNIGRLDPGVRAAESQGSTPFYVAQNGNLFDPQTGVSVSNKAVSGDIA